jgi:hypothetical protein
VMERTRDNKNMCIRLLVRTLKQRSDLPTVFNTNHTGFPGKVKPSGKRLCIACTSTIETPVDLLHGPSSCERRYCAPTVFAVDDIMLCGT